MCRLAHYRHSVLWLSAAGAMLVAAACQDVSVTTVAADRIEIDPTTAQIQVDQTVRFTARVLSESGQLLSGRTVEWTSLQPGVAMVDGTGTARALTPGSAVIRATSEGTSVDATVTVTAGPAPVIAASPQELSFSGVEDGPTPGDRAVAVTNAGTGNLAGLSAVITYAAGQPTGWLSASLSSTSAPAILIVSANQAGLPPGRHVATISLSAPGVSNSPVTVSVSLTVTPKQLPAIGLSRSSISFAAVAGGADPPSQTVSVTNEGGGTLGGLSATVSYVGQGSGWLTATLSGTTAPATLTLAAATGSLAPGTYSATVRVSSNEAANSPQQIQVSFAVAGAAPGAPSNLTATTVSSSRIDLGWTAASGVVQEYQIERKLAAGGSYAAIASVSGATTSYQDTGLQPATGYVYRVRACGTAGCSGWSNEAGATTTTAPQQPAIGLSPTTISFAADVGGASPAVQMVAVTNLGGGTLGGLSATVSYLSPTTGWLTATLSGTTAPATLTLAVTTGTLVAGTYSAIVQVSSSEAANSPQQIQVSFTVAGGVPGALSSLTASPVSSTQIDLAWTAASGVVQQYQIERKLAAGGDYAPIASVSGGTTTHQDTGLLPSTGYVYRVRACAAAGCSEWSNEASATTAPASLGVPGNLTGTAISSTEIQLSWTAPGGQTRYEIRRRTGGQFTNIATVPGDMTTYVDTGLTPSTTYQYQIRACDASCSDWSGMVSVTTAPD